MIIHNPIVSGSLTFANNATLTSAESSITGSFKGDLLSTNGIVSSSNQVTSLLPTGVISGSSQLPSGTVSGSSQITITESQISDLSHYTDANVKTKLNTETVISGSSQVVLNSANKTGFDTADVAENASYLYYTDARVKTKLNTEGVISSSVEGSSQGQIDFNGSAIDVNNLGTGDSPTFANLTLTGDLSVQGTTTTVNSTTVNIGDNIINLNYGGSSTTGGIYVKDGTGASTTSGSLLWDSTNDYWKAGKLGTEQKILLENGDGVLSGSAQVVSLLPAGTISGSSQVNINSTTGTLTTLGTVTSGDVTAILPSGVISGSAQVGVNNSTITLNTAGGLIGGGSITLNQASDETITFTIAGGIISGSSQVNADSITNFDSNVKAKLNADTVISGSSQVNINSTTGTLTTLGTVTSGDVTAILPSGVISGSAQIEGNFLEVNGDNVVSSSAQIDALGFLKVDGDNVISSSAQLTGIFDSRYLNTNGDGVISGSSQVVLNSADKTGFDTDDVTEGSTNQYYTDARVKTKLNTEGVISGSSQVNADSITNFDSNVKDKLNTDGIISSSAQVNADTIQQFDANVQDVLNTDGVISGSTQVIASDTFNFDTAVTNVMDGATVISGSDQVTSSLDSRYVNSTGNETISGNKTFSNNVIVSGDLTVAGTTTTTSTNNVIVGDNIIDLNYGGGATDGGLYVTDVTVSGLETGSLLWDGVQNRWVAGVKNSEIKILLAEGDGIISSSAQLTDTFLEINGDNVVSGSSQISADQTDGWADDVKTQLNSNTVVSSSAQLTNTFLQIDGQGVISGSSQITITESQISDLSHYTDADVKTKLNAEGVISSSAQVTITESQISDLTHYTDSDVKTKLNNDNVVSGSNQIDGTGITNNTINIAGTSTALGGSITAAKILEGTGTISGSSQLTNVATDFGTGRVSGNNIGNLSGTTTFTGSFVGDGSSLSGVTSYTDADTLSYINSQNVFSSSIQVDVTSTTNYSSINQYSDSKVKTYLDSQTVISGSSQITITESQISDLTHYTDSDVKTKLNAEGVFSSSAQIEGNFLEVNGDNVVSSSAQISSYNVFLEKNGDNVVSGSGQLSNVFLSKDGDGVISSSAQLTGTFDSRYLNVNGDNVVSGAAQLYTDLDARYGNEEGEGLISSSAQIQGFGIFAELNGDGLISGSAQLTDTFLEINGDGVHSGSAQVVSSLVSATGISSGNKTTIQSNLGVDAAGTDNSTDVSLGVSSYDYITLDAATQVITLGQVDASTDISNLSTTNVSEGSNLYYTDSRVKTKLNSEGVISGSSQITITESQISDLNHYDATDFASDFNSKSTTYLSEGSNLYYTDARVKTKLNTEGVVSGSSQISLSGFDTDDLSEGSTNLYYTDNRVKTKLDDENVVSGSATQVRTFLNVENNADVTDAANVTSGLVAATGISAGNKTTIRTNLGVDAAGTDNSTDVTFTTNGYDYITLSGQTITLNQVDASTDISNLTTSNVSEGSNLYYTDARVKTKLNTEGVISGSSQITITESQISDLVHYTDSDWDTRLATKSTTNLSEGTNLYYTDARVKTKLNAEGVISGSSQITITESQISDLDHYTDSDWDTRLATKSTDNLSEGSTNKYASTANVKSALNANLGTLTLGDSDDTISIPGNLTVSGTTNFINSNTLNIGDNNIVLNADVTGTPTQNGGITIERGTETNATLLWDETNDYWKAGLAGSEVQIALVNGTYSGLRAQATTKGDVGLGNVENTALSTYTGQGGALDNQYITNGAGYITSFTNTNQLTTFQVEDGDGTEVTISHGKEWKFVEGTGIDINWTNTSNGTDADPYDLTITNTAPFTGDVFDNDGTFASLRAQGTTKGDVGLGNVENTALSTWAGSPYLTTLGVISTGTWQGNAIADAYLSSNTAHLSGTQTFSGAKTFSAAVNISNSTASTTKTTGALIVTGGVGVSGALNVGGDVVAYASSDERLKDNIELISNPIEKVQSLKGVTWNWNENADELQQSLPNVGVIAQDVEKVLPQLVTDRDNGFKGVDYAKLTGLLIEAIKEQQKQIDELKSKLQ